MIFGPPDAPTTSLTFPVTESTMIVGTMDETEALHVQDVMLANMSTARRSDAIFTWSAAGVDEVSRRGKDTVAVTAGGTRSEVVHLVVQDDAGRRRHDACAMNQRMRYMRKTSLQRTKPDPK